MTPGAKTTQRYQTWRAKYPDAMLFEFPLWVQRHATKYRALHGIRSGMPPQHQAGFDEYLKGAE
jgi:hypothetical protein